MRHWSGSSLWLLLHPPCWVLSGTSLDYPCAMEILQLWICRSGPFIWFSSLMGIRFSSSLCVVWYNLVVSVETLIFAIWVQVSLKMSASSLFLNSLPCWCLCCCHHCYIPALIQEHSIFQLPPDDQSLSRNPPGLQSAKQTAEAQQAVRLRSSQMFILSGWWQA